MSQMTKRVVEPLQVAAFGLPVSRPDGDDSRTLRKQYLLDTVLPAATLLSISVLTVTLIVLVVTTVAHGGWLAPGTYVSIDPWANLHPGSATRSGDGIVYPDVERNDLAFDPEARYGADAVYSAGRMAE